MRARVILLTGSCLVVAVFMHFIYPLSLISLLALSLSLSLQYQSSSFSAILSRACFIPARSLVLVSWWHYLYLFVTSLDIDSLSRSRSLDLVGTFAHSHSHTRTLSLSLSLSLFHERWFFDHRTHYRIVAVR